MRQQGKIIKWLDDKGYGFVDVNHMDGTKQQVFVHISAFQKEQNHPEVGEEITFEIVKDNFEREQARNIFYINRPLLLVPEVAIQSRDQQENQRDQSRMKIQPGQQRLGSGYGYGENQGQPRKRSFKTLFYMILFSFLALKATEHLVPDLYHGNGAKMVQTVPTPILENNDKHEITTKAFQCAGKTRCNEMTSCDEAMFYLKNCPGALADGDGDGIPCEDQWCGH